ncbi:MAG: DUF4292 domain-containing protein [Saprospiraceae bacterium]|nr:DUF4292 domain-containing protein [Saprospiraceae bacterium]
MRILFFILTVVFISCSAKKIATATKEKSEAEVLNALTSRNIPFEWFEAKINTDIESPDESMSGSMHLRMKKDSAVLVNVRKFGFEVARFYANVKQYTLLYRLERIYEQGDISRMADIISIKADFNDFQQLIAGNVILPDPGTTTISYDSTAYFIQGKSNDLSLSYHINKSDLRLESMSIIDKMQRKITIDYSDYRQLPGFGPIAYKRSVVYPHNAGSNGRLTLDFTEIIMDKPAELKFSIPDNYEKSE